MPNIDTFKLYFISSLAGVLVKSWTTVLINFSNITRDLFVSGSIPFVRTKLFPEYSKYNVINCKRNKKYRFQLLGFIL